MQMFMQFKCRCRNSFVHPMLADVIVTSPCGIVYETAVQHALAGNAYGNSIHLWQTVLKRQTRASASHPRVNRWADRSDVAET